MTLSIRPLRSHLSLRSLRTAFSHHTAASPSTSPTVSETNAMSPSAVMGSHPRAYHPAAGENHAESEPRFSSQSDASTAFEPSAAPRRVIRKKKSMLQLEQEDERMNVDDALVSLVEPRPASLMPTLGGIEEVIEGRI